MLPADAIAYLQAVSADEPVFVLRARDYYAPSTVALWAGQMEGVVSKDEEVRAKAKLKAQRARALVIAMRSWQNKNRHLVKIPD